MEAAVNDQMLRVQGLSQLLRAVAGRIESDIDGLNKELLLQSAEQLDNLEIVANNAQTIIERVPRAKRGRSRKLVQVNLITLIDLADALETAGRPISRANV
jgi:hypothetical protein